jgi:hypothetical protein
MSQYARSEVQMRITCHPEGATVARSDEGAVSGYFDDQVTKTLLGLGAEDPLLSTGTYGLKEPGQRPISLTLLREDIYDRRLLPFVPHEFSFESALDLHELNHQWHVYANTTRELKEELYQARASALAVASNVPLSLPAYARELLPKFLYRESETRDFQYQLQPFFSPSAIRARWVRIRRVIAMLEAYVNVCSRIESNRAEWKLGEPIGAFVNPDDASPEDLELARAYHYLGVPIVGLPQLEEIEGYGLEDARNALLSRKQGKAAPVKSFSDSPDYLEGTNDDALDYSIINPSFDKNLYNDDGSRKTAAQRRADREDEYEENVFGGPNEMMEDLTMNARPSGTPRHGEETTPADTSSVLGVSLGERTGALHSSRFHQTSSIESSSPSASASAFSSTSSTNTPHSSGQGSSSRRSHRSGSSNRSWNWSNTANSRRYEPYESRGRQHAPSPRNTALAYQPRREVALRQQQSIATGSRYQGPAPQQLLVPATRANAVYIPPAPAAATPMVPARQQQVLLRDTATGMMASVPIIDTSFSSLGLARPAAEARSEPRSATPVESRGRGRGQTGPSLRPQATEYRERGRSRTEDFGYNSRASGYVPPRGRSRGYGNRRDDRRPRSRSRSRSRQGAHSWGASDHMDIDPPADPSRLWGAPSPLLPPLPDELAPEPSTTFPAATSLSAAPRPTTSPSFPTIADAYRAAINASLMEQEAAPPPYPSNTGDSSRPREE